MKKIKKTEKQELYKRLFVYGMLFFIVLIVIASYLSRGTYLINLFFLDQNDQFMDFFNSIQYGSNPYDYGVIYPPLINALYAFWGHFIPLEIRCSGTFAIRNSNVGMMVFFIYNIVQLMILSAGIKSILNLSKIENFYYTLIILCSQPVLWCLQRGNSVLLSVVSLFLFVILYDSDSKTHQRIAYIMLGISAAIKIYPAIYGILYIRKSDWKQTAKCILYGVLCFFLPFLFFEGGFSNVPKLISNIINCSNEFGLNRYGVKHNLKNLYNIINTWLGTDLNYMFTVLTVVIVFISIAIILASKNLEIWKIYTLLSALIILIPSFSYTYNLTYMLIPLVAFLGNKNKTPSKWNYIYSILFVLLFAPIIQSSDDLLGITQLDNYPLTFGTIVQNIALVGMIILICTEGCHDIYKSIKKQNERDRILHRRFFKRVGQHNSSSSS